MLCLQVTQHWTSINHRVIILFRKGFIMVVFEAALLYSKEFSKITFLCTFSGTFWMEWGMVFSTVIYILIPHICSTFLNTKSTCRTSHPEIWLGISLQSFKFYLMTLLITVTICRAHEKKYFFSFENCI